MTDQSPLDRETLRAEHQWLLAMLIQAGVGLVCVALGAFGLGVWVLVTPFAAGLLPLMSAGLLGVGTLLLMDAYGRTSGDHRHSRF